MQIIQQTDEEKLAMYMKLSKEELAKMLIECNRILASGTISYVYNPTNSGFSPIRVIPYQEPKICDCKLKDTSTGPFMCHAMCQH